jgi:hypothetical protein
VSAPRPSSPLGLGVGLFLLAIALAMAGCAGDIGGGGPQPPGGGTGGVGSVGSTGETPTTSNLGQACATTRMAPPLLRRLSALEYRNTIQQVFRAFTDAGADWGAQIALREDTLSRLRLGNDASVLLVGDQSAKEVLSSAENVASYVTAAERLPTLLPCAAAAANDACADGFIDDYGGRLFRRPLTADERTSYQATFRSVSGRSDFRTGLKWTLVAMLQSPHTLYRSEVGTKAGDGYRLTPHEIASELSYNFSGQPPSADLIARMESGQLDDPTLLVAEARKLLLTPGGQEVLRHFFRQWSLYERVISETKTIAGFEAVRTAMTEETRLFIDEVVVARNGGVKELLTAPFTVLDSALAQFYRYGAPAAGWTVVDRPADAAVGLLAQGSILAGHAHQDSSSPTLRGLLVFERLLCNDRPSPPPNVPRIEDPVPGVKTTRQRYEEAHAGQTGCRECHLHFDPIGFAFERFDEVGRFRADEQGLPIDTRGMAMAEGKVLASFDGLSDLAAKLAALPAVANCVGGFIETYTFGGGGGESCLAAEERAGLVEGRYGLLDFMARLAASPNFVRRAPPR